MWYYQLPEDASDRVVLETSDGIYDLSAARASVDSFEDLVVAADIAGMDLADISRRLAETAPTVDRDTIEEDAARPVVPSEVWASGVTYKISEEARQRESGRPDVYMDVYDAERPEVFFKATPSRTVGPGDAIGIRGDSNWNVPEPELAAVLHNGEIVGYTVGNDVSSRELEGQNPLYLPQAKVYDKCAAIGPCIADTAAISNPHSLEMTMQISRNGETVFEESTNTSEMVRSVDKLVSAFRDHNAVPEFAVMMTGTSLVPADDFTLADGDRVDITIEGIGTLSNPVEVV